MPPGEFVPVAPGPGAARSRIGLSVGSVGVVLLLVMGMVVVRGLRGQSTGADNPDDLVTLLQSAITKKDPAAAIALLDPDEVPTLGDLYKTTVDKVRSSQDVDVPKALEAISISVSGVSHTTTYLGARNDVAKISFSSNTGKGNGSPLMGLFPEAQTRAFRIYSKALRAQMDQAGGSFFSPGSGSFSTGSESFSIGSGGSSSSDSGGSMPGDFTGGPMSADGTFDGLAAECSGCGIHYRDLKVRTTTQGSTTYAVIEGLTVEVTTNVCPWGDMAFDSSIGYDGSFNGGPEPCTPERETETLTWDGHCITIKTTSPTGRSGYMGFDEDGKACLGDPSKPGKLNATDFGIVDAHVVVSAERGGWVIDPVATILDYGRTALSHLDDPKVRSILNDEH